jgi:hypothetical protein
VAKRRKEKRIYKYECSLTGDTYQLTEKCDNPEELMSVNSWYELNPDKDDRPDDIKKKLGLQLAEKEKAQEKEENANTEN